MTKKILLVDDDKLLRESMGAMLRSGGYQVVEAADGQAGLEVAAQEVPHLVITDIRMPVMDGLTFVQKLRETENGAQLPVVILTNDETPGALNQALTSGVTVYLAKSNLDAETLSQQVASVLGE